jgi:Concanavalin A-like lectin/glucanases superfamily
MIIGSGVTIQSGVNTTSQTVDSIDYLLVGGGGAGGISYGGGGGAGGVLSGSTPISANTPYEILVGAGGTGQASSSNGEFIGTQGNNTSINPNWTGKFNGTSDYLTIPSNTALAFGTGDYTVEFWVNFTATPSGIVCLYNTNNTNFFFQYNPGTGFQTGIVGISATTTFAFTIATNVWYHVAVTRSSSTTRCWINGIQIGTSQTDSTNYGQNGAQIAGLSGGQLLTGYMSNVRIVKGLAVYTSAFTPPSQTLTTTQVANTNGYPSAAISGQTSLLTLQNSTFIDNANNFVITQYGFPTLVPNLSTAWSSYFNGTNQYLTAPSNTVYEFGTGDFTVEGWYYWNTFVNNVDSGLILLGQGANAGGITSSWWMRYYSGIYGNFLSWYRTDGTSPEINYIFPITLNAGQWYHIACTRSGTDLRFFVNGTQVGAAQTCTTDYTIVNGDPLQIGKSNTGNSPGIHYFNGYISNVRVTKGVALYTGTFTPSTKSLTPTQLTNVNGFSSAPILGTQTSLLTLQNSTIKDNSTNAFTITNNGTVTTNTNMSPFNLTAFGGGQGAPDGGAAGSGGSGGGSNYTGSAAIGYGIIGQGYNGGAGDTTYGNYGGGGGGAGQVGYAGTDGTYPGQGGNGSESTIANLSQYGGILFNQNYLTVPLSSLFDQNGSWTIETWFYPTGIGGYGYSYLWGANAQLWGVYWDGTAGTFIADDAYIGSITSPATFTQTNKWYHVALSSNGTTTRLFVNGILQGTFAGTGVAPDYTNPLQIGIAFNGPYGYSVTGYLSNMRFVKGVAVYTSNFTVPTQPLASTQSTNSNGNPSAAITGTQTVLLLNMNNNASYTTDSSSYSQTVTTQGPPTSTSLNPFVNTYFGGGGGGWYRYGTTNGGLGGGGGSGYSTNGIDGASNTGGGGGSTSGRDVGGFNSGNGGSGVAIIRYSNLYPPAITTGSPTYTVGNGYRVYQYTGTGTFLIGSLPAPVTIDYLNASNVVTSSQAVFSPGSYPVVVTSGNVGVRYPIQYAAATIFTNATYSVANGYRVYTFTSTGTISWNQPGSTTPAIEYLSVAGGGGGAGGGVSGGAGGGGGAGGFLTGTNQVIKGDTITITVGSGGAASTSQYVTGSNGGNSTLVSSSISILSYGGGGGGADQNKTGSSGGSGGGTAINAGGPIALGVIGQGTNGSLGDGAGGGGAGQAGQCDQGGGNGLQSNITGTLTYYAGGGGGYGRYAVEPGGLGGGGNGSYATDYGSPGVVNTGGGGGGGNALGGAAGGSGIIIIRYPLYYNAAVSTTGSPTVTTTTDYRIYTFTASGSITF